MRYEPYRAGVVVVFSPVGNYNTLCPFPALDNVRALCVALKDVDCRKGRDCSLAIMQVNREPDIPFLQTETIEPHFLGLGPVLCDAMHRETTCVLKPALFADPCKQFQKGVAIATCAMAEIRSLGEGARLPDQLARTEQQFVDVRVTGRILAQ